MKKLNQETERVLKNRNITLEIMISEALRGN
jgi:hypothetical protein